MDKIQERHNLLCCPQCHLIDQVRKVSAIHRDGIVTTAGTRTNMIYTNGNLRPVPTTNTQQTSLSKMLEPPQMLSAPPTGEEAWQALLFVPIVIVILNLNSLSVLQLIPILGAYLLLAVFVHKRFSAARWEREQEQRRLARQWQKRYQLWEGLFYCYRCDGVFDPGEYKIVDPWAIEELYSDLE